MSLDKKHVMIDTKMGLVDLYCEGEFGINEEPPKSIFEEGENSEEIRLEVANSNGYNSSFSTPRSSNSNGYSVINFKGGYGNFRHSANGSLLSFEQSERFCPNPRMNGNQVECSVWEDNNSLTPKGSSITTHVEESPFNKRPSTEDSTQRKKKQCYAASKEEKPNNCIATKDPQSIAAKNRRERISERLKILQELVPNGSKVDIVTMLEKAIGYVKFLQLQVKVLATDEFWPTQDGNASQVKEAIDAILDTQRDRNSCSK